MQTRTTRTIFCADPMDKRWRHLSLGCTADIERWRRRRATKKVTATTRCTLKREVSLKYVLIPPIRRRCKIQRDHGAAGQWGRDQPRRACTPEMGEHELLPFLLGSTGCERIGACAPKGNRSDNDDDVWPPTTLLARWVGWLSALCGFRRVFEIGGGERAGSPRSNVGEPSED